MSGHSKWHSIKHKKGAADAARGKVFTRHAKLITIAAQTGGDLETNPRLRTEVERAKTAGVPNANIDRAIKKGTGELGGDRMEEVYYEGYAPGGIGILIRCLTDNKNRTVQAVRLAVTRNGGNMGDSGSVAYMFSMKGLILAKIDPSKADEMEMLAIEAGADDISIDEDTLEVITAKEDLQTVEKALIDAGLTIEKSEITQIAGTTIDAGANEEKLEKIVEALEEIDDVDEVFHNAA